MKLAKIEALEAQSAVPNFWDEATAAQKIMREITRLRQEVEVWQQASRRLADAIMLAEMDDPELAEELIGETAALQQEVDDLEFRTLLSSLHDEANALLAIHAGAGGTEAQDWAQMLQRMFIRWAEKHKFVVDILDFTPGDEAGMKSVLMSVKGEYAFGRLLAERGVHRLVRLSPFDSSSRRHTSFAKVEVWPDVAEEIEIEINEKDLEIQRFKASGAGGQHVQKNETAIRIRHIPTGFVVSCQNQRSLTQNMESAMNVLKSQLYELEQRKQNEAISELKGDDVDAGWGSQIRSYVLHPYKMVKDHRTGHETGNTQAVLDGDLDDFIGAYLKHKIGEAGSG
jgi:peptide chain release factor 2